MTHTTPPFLAATFPHLRHASTILLPSWRGWLVHSSKLHSRVTFYFSMHVTQTPPFLTKLVHPSKLHRFTFAPCVMIHTPPTFLNDAVCTPLLTATFSSCHHACLVIRLDFFGNRLSSSTSSPLRWKKTRRPSRGRRLMRIKR